MRRRPTRESLPRRRRRLRDELPDAGLDSAAREFVDRRTSRRSNARPASSRATTSVSSTRCRPTSTSTSRRATPRPTGRRTRDLDELLPGYRRPRGADAAHRRPDEIPRGADARGAWPRSPARCARRCAARTRCPRRRPSSSRWSRTSRGRGSTTTSATTARGSRSTAISPQYMSSLPHLIAHEAYPGHHTEHCRKEQFWSAPASTNSRSSWSTRRSA